MKFALSTNGSEISQHFGRCSHFVIVDIQDGAEVSREKIERPEIEHPEVPPMLAKMDVKYIVTGGMGARAKKIFVENGVKTILGANGDFEAIIKVLIAGKLDSTEVPCDHGDHHGDCGNH